MALLIWMLTWLSQVLPAMSELPQPANMNLTSSHFIHLLKWESGPGTPKGVYYHVSVNTERGTTWDPVAGCESVQQPLICNLTEAFSDPEQVYLTKITPLLETQASQPLFHPGFQPIKDTHLDLPLLTVMPCDGTLCVGLQPPIENLRDVYDSLHYTLRIESKGANRAQQFFKDTKSLRREILEDLAPGRQYCLSVCFSDSLVPRKSNYSQPICAFTPGSYTADTDALISAMLCLFLLFTVGVLVLLVYSGSICLKRRPLPSVLTSIHHFEEDLVLAPSITSLYSFLSFKPMLPSSGQKRSSQTLSNHSNGESDTESTGGTSSSSSAQPEPSLTLKPTSNYFNSPPEALLSTQTNPNAGLKKEPSTHTVSDQCTPKLCPPADTPSLTVKRGVDLLTLTFGRQEKDEEEKSSSELSCASEVYCTTPVLHSLTTDIEGLSCSINEDEEEEHSGYMGRQSTEILLNFLSKPLKISGTET